MLRSKKSAAPFKPPASCSHLLAHWDSLTPAQQDHLRSQIETINPAMLLRQKEMLSSPPVTHSLIKPFNEYSLAESAESLSHKKLGEQLISEGKVGVLIIAGGQGSRLRFDGPKGMFPVSVIKQKSLFQLFAEKTIAAGAQAGLLLPLAIMTSPVNHQETVDFFRAHLCFGLQENQITFFCQSVLPLLDDQGELFLESPSEIARGPNGNGNALVHFYESGAWEQWWNQGVRHLSLLTVDNPLADPFDTRLIGFHAKQAYDVTVKCAAKTSPEEKVGVLVRSEGKVCVVEYSEMSNEQRHALLSNGELAYQCANLSLFCFDMTFIHDLVTKHKDEMPLHLAHKAVKRLFQEGETLLPGEPNAWKFEFFIFDALPFAKRVGALLFPRDQCFAPLKNFSGENSIQSVQMALRSQDALIFSNISGKASPSRPFELAQEFHYPTPELLQKWKGRDLPNQTYIEG